MVSVNRAIYSLYTVAAVAIVLIAGVIMFYEHEIAVRDRAIDRLSQQLESTKRQALIAYRQISNAQAEILECRLSPESSYERIGDATQLLYSIAHK